MSSSRSSSSPRWWWQWAPTLGLMLLIALFSSIPGHSLPPVGAMGWDKVVHAAEFAVLGALFYRAMAATPVVSSYAAVLAIAAAVLFGISDELHQSMVPGRFPDVFDAVADTVGAVLGVALFSRLSHKTI